MVGDDETLQRSIECLLKAKAVPQNIIELKTGELSLGTTPIPNGFKEILFAGSVELVGRVRNRSAILSIFAVISLSFCL